MLKVDIFSETKITFSAFLGFAALLFTIYFNKFVDYTSTNEFCAACHVHPHATESWRLSHTMLRSRGCTLMRDATCHLGTGLSEA